MPPKHNSPKIQVGWTTVTYRSVLLMVLLVVGVIAAGTYIAFPDQSKKVAGKAWDLTGGKLASVGQDKKPAATQQSASFTLIDGTVKVKKANRNDWINADYQRLSKKATSFRPVPRAWQK